MSNDSFSLMSNDWMKMYGKSVYEILARAITQCVGKLMFDMPRWKTNLSRQSERSEGNNVRYNFYIFHSILVTYLLIISLYLYRARQTLVPILYSIKSISITSSV